MGHRADRQRWETRIKLGIVPCRRCGELIRPDEPWGPRSRRPRPDASPGARTSPLQTGRRGRMRRSGGSEGAGCTGRGRGVGNGYPRRPEHGQPPISTPAAIRNGSTMRCGSCDPCPFYDPWCCPRARQPWHMTALATPATSSWASTVTSGRVQASPEPVAAPSSPSVRAGGPASIARHAALKTDTFRGVGSGQRIALLPP